MEKNYNFKNSICGRRQKNPCDNVTQSSNCQCNSSVAISSVSKGVESFEPTSQ